jgi:glycosyltransferase involved in cell wall biosynthesis
LVLGDASAASAIVPNGVELDYWQRSGPPSTRPTIAFTGAMDYPPNIDAAIHLVNEILPLVRELVPNARVLIVGRDPVPEVRSLNGSGVTVTGAVPDVRPYLEEAAVFAAPLRFAAGIQNKVLEAMAFQLPIVAYGPAVTGVLPASGEKPPVETAEGPADCANRIVSLLHRVRAGERPGDAGRDFAARHFTWAASGASLLTAAASVTRRRGKDPS